MRLAGKCFYFSSVESVSCDNFYEEIIDIRGTLLLTFNFQAIKQGRIYALRYELCDDMNKSPDLTDQDPRRDMWNFLSPIALFASANVGQQNEIVPVAIQMDYRPG